MNNQNKRLFEHVVNVLSKHSHSRKVDLWVCVGSRVTNTNKNQSDIDLLAFGDSITEFSRQKQELDCIQVSVCFVPLTMLNDDAYSGAYGGYFAAKLFHPNQSIIKKESAICDEVKCAAARYFFPFVNSILSETKLEDLTAENITSLALLAFLRICPDYDSYWLRNVHGNQEGWQQTVSQFTEALNLAGILFDGRSKKLTCNDQRLLRTAKEDVHRQLVDRVARHWAFAAINHGSDLSFYDWYKKKAQDTIMQYGGYNGKEYRSMIKFIEDLSGMSI